MTSRENLPSECPKSVSVLVPTWRRPDSLSRCLQALADQERSPNQVVITIREDDVATWARMDVLQRLFNEGVVKTVAVPAGPLTRAMNLGLAWTHGDVVALTDDDSEARPDWLRRMLGHFSDPEVVGVGGRDWQPQEPGAVEGERAVGRAAWFGRITGNHHLGSGPHRDVDVLKGVNCGFRGNVLRDVGFDERLRGRGNVSHWEMSLCLSLRRGGWRLVYDPGVATDHYVGVRHDGDTNARGIFAAAPHADAVHNETLATLEHLSPVGRFAFALWAAVVGTRGTPGFAQLFRLGLAGHGWSHQTRRFGATMRGRIAGWRAYRRSMPHAADHAAPSDTSVTPDKRVA